MTDAGFIAKTADLLHLLKYATILCESPGDAARAQQLVEELRRELARPMIRTQLTMNFNEVH
jgi:hypothetical protein